MSLEADEKFHVAMDTKESRGRGTGECIAPFTKKKKDFTIYIFLFSVLILLRDYGQRNIIPITFIKREWEKKVLTFYNI